MSPLAEAIYEILRRRVGCEDPHHLQRIGGGVHDYDEAFEYVHHRNPQLYLALVEIGRECRRERFPPMPALVVRGLGAAR